MNTVRTVRKDSDAFRLLRQIAAAGGRPRAALRGFLGQHTDRLRSLDAALDYCSGYSNMVTVALRHYVSTSTVSLAVKDLRIFCEDVGVKGLLEGVLTYEE